MHLVFRCPYMNFPYYPDDWLSIHLYYKQQLDNRSNLLSHNNIEVCPSSFHTFNCLKSSYDSRLVPTAMKAAAVKKMTNSSGRGTISEWTGSGTTWLCGCSRLCGRATQSKSGAQMPELSINPLVRWWGGRRWDYELQESRDRLLRYEHGTWQLRLILAKKINK